jgi:hypothetical protein
MSNSLLHDKLKNLRLFIDNEHLQNYVRLVESRKGIRSRGTLSNKHHIIPRSWFKMFGEEIDNSPRNLVVLTYREHVLAHYYLCLCTTGKLQYANELALICLISRKCLSENDRHLIKSLPLYNNVYESYIKHSNS